MQITRIFMRYILRQILSSLIRLDTLVVSPNIMLQQFRRPSHWIGIMTIAWGTVMTLMAIVQNSGGLVATRFCLGITEVGFILELS